MFRILYYTVKKSEMGQLTRRRNSYENDDVSSASHESVCATVFLSFFSRFIDSLFCFIRFCFPCFGFYVTFTDPQGVFFVPDAIQHYLNLMEVNK